MASTGKQRIHASGSFLVSTGAAVCVGTGNWTAANIAAGIADLTLGEPIDVTERVVTATSQVQSTMVATIPANDTDTVVRFHVEDDTGADADSVVAFTVWRV